MLIPYKVRTQLERILLWKGRRKKRRAQSWELPLPCGLTEEIIHLFTQIHREEGAFCDQMLDCVISFLQNVWWF